ncbi:MAG: T9SS type A sorting domain-containing protein [Bacteroidota bacterium]
MKSKLLLILLLPVTFSMCFGQFQKTVGIVNKHYHDLNLEPMNDGTDDFIVAGNLFDATMQNEELTLKRVDQNGVVVWIKKYTNAGLVHARVFDMVTLPTDIYITGSVDVSGVRKMFIAQIQATTGAFIQANYYDIVGPNFNSRGLKIIHTLSDADGDGVNDPGFVVGGFFSDCYAVDINCTFNNIGFVLRTDLGLNHLWTTEIDANNPINTLEYDFVNGITETNDGFFITGSATGVLPSNAVQQAVLAHKLDFAGTFVWDSSYIFGNSNDLSTDAYFDAASNEIYVLANYSISHYFGVTVLNNTTGATSTSWVATGADLDKYGFRIMESINSNNNLVITGYDRDENWTNSSGSFTGQSTPFVYEFVKATGAQVGTSYQYLVPHAEPTGDEFNFWSGQMPLIYYPDISTLYLGAGGGADYYHVGYRTNPSATFSETELYRTPVNYRNECDFQQLQLSPNSITLQAVPVTSGGIPVATVPLTLTDAVIAFQISMCDPSLGVEHPSEENIRLHPNPASDYVHIDGNGVSQLEIVDALGRTIRRQSIASGSPIFIGDLVPGMYFLRVSGESGIEQTFRLLKR